MCVLRKQPPLLLLPAEDRIYVQTAVSVEAGSESDSGLAVGIPSSLLTGVCGLPGTFIQDILAKHRPRCRNLNLGGLGTLIS